MKFPSLQLSVDQVTGRHISGDLVGPMGEFYGRLAGINRELADEMVARCNAHGDLVAALQALLNAHDKRVSWFSEQTWDIARAALTKATRTKETA